MKKYKGMKITLIILIIILLSIISFIGIYVQDKNQMKNIMPEYLLARDLEGYRRVEMKVDDSAETINYDAEGKEIESTDTETQVAKTEEKKVNADEILTTGNYEKSKQVIEKRLKTMQVNDYIIRQDSENGNIVLELPENSNTDRVVNQLYLQGKFEIVDSDTNEVLMTNDDIKSVESGYGQYSTGAIVVYININFNKEGTQKFKDITNTYVQTTMVKQNEETGESEEETITKKISLNIDDYTIYSDYFDEEISNGTLQLKLGSSSNNTTEELQEYLLEANSKAALLDSGKMPIVYEVEHDKYIYSDVTLEQLEIAISVMIVVLTIGMLYLIIKYKTKGILGSISLVGYVAILLIALRFFNVEISIGGIVGIALSIAISYFIIARILKQNEVMEVIKKYAIILIPALIISIVFTFMNISMGIVIFWGIVISLLYNLSITNMIIKD